MWQKCPVCNGTSDWPQHCDVCNGTLLIHELTGKPPVDLKRSEMNRIRHQVEPSGYVAPNMEPRDLSRVQCQQDIDHQLDNIRLARKNIDKDWNEQREAIEKIQAKHDERVNK
jgi:hypothetical protein